MFSLVAILSLALGVGANTAIFQLVDAVRLRSLPIARARRSCYNVRIGPTEGPHGQLLGPLAAADLGALGSHPRRAEGVLEARRLELRPA